MQGIQDLKESGSRAATEPVQIRGNSCGGGWETGKAARIEGTTVQFGIFAAIRRRTAHEDAAMAKAAVINEAVP